MNQSSLSVLLSYIIIVYGGEFDQFDWKSVRNERLSVNVCNDQWYMESEICSGASKLNYSVEQCSCDSSCHNYNDCCIDISRTEEKIEKIEHQEETCIQFHDGFKAYVTNSCSNEWNDTVSFKSEIKRKCTLLDHHSNSTFYLYDIPVLSKSKKRIYKNIFCSICNNDVGDVPGRTELKCDLDGIVYNLESNVSINSTTILNEIQNPKNYNEDTRTWHISLRNQRLKCYFKVENYSEHIISEYGAHLCDHISTCSKNWTDDAIKMKCESYAAYIYAASSSGEQIIYKNYHCALCNYVSLNDLICSKSGKEMTRYFSTTSFSILMDFSGLNIDDGWVGSSQTKLCSLKDGEFYDVLKMECFKYHCGAGSDWDPELQNCTSKNAYDNSTMNDLPISKCRKVLIRENEYIFTDDNGTIYVNRTGKLYTSNEYEVYDQAYTTKDVLICVEKSFVNVPLVNNTVESILTQFCLYASVISLILHLIVYIYLPKLRNLPGKNLMSLSVAILGAHVSFIVASNTEPNTGSIQCIGSSLLMHYFFLSSFFWMNVMAYDVWKTFARTQRMNKHTNTFQFVRYSVYSWISPAIIVLFSGFMDMILEESAFKPFYGYRVCWINKKIANLIYFILPLSMMIIINFVLFSITIYNIYQTTSQANFVKKDKPLKERIILYIKLAIIMGLTWIFGFLAEIIDYQPLWIPFILFNGLQGTFIFFSFTVKRKIINQITNTSVNKTSTELNSSENKLSSKTTISSGFSIE